MLTAESTSQIPVPANQSFLTEARLRFALEIEPEPRAGRSVFITLSESVNTFAIFAHAVVEEG